MSTYKYFNPNPDAKIDKKTGKPKRWNRDDCVIRAFAGFLNLSWSTVFIEMCSLAAKMFEMPNSSKVIDAYAKSKGLIKVSLPEYISVRRFAEMNHGNYIVNIRSHVSWVGNGFINDTWDCGRYKMKTYYKKER